MHSKLSMIVLFLVFALSACEKSDLSTGLEGAVFKGPINPVEIEGQVNDAPFAAVFHVYNLKDSFIKSFSSDENGNFKVLLEPGDYNIRPNDEAPIIHPEQQVKTVHVDPGSMTEEDLYFDTGIR